MGAKRVLRRILGVLFLLIAGVMLLHRSRIWVDAAYLSLIPMLLCALRLLAADAKHLDLPESAAVRLRRAIVSALLTLVWLAMLSVLELREARLFSRAFLREVYADAPGVASFYFYFNRFCYLPGICAGTWGLLYGVFTRCERGLTPLRTEPLPEPARKRLARRGWLCMLALTAACVLCVYPIYPVSDTLLIKSYIDNGEWNAWHTMGYLFFVFVTSLGGWNYFLVVVAQGCCFALAQWTAICFLSKRANGARAVTAYTVLSLLSFLPYLYCGVMYKDSLFATCLLGLCAALSEVIASEDARWPAYVRLALFGLGAALFRHGAFIAVLAAMLALVLYMWRKRRAQLLRTGIAAAAMLCAYIGVDRILPRALHATASPGYVMYTVPMGMIGAIAKSGVPIEADERAVMERIMPYEEWAEAYDPYFMDPISRPDGAIGERVKRIDELGLGPALLKLNARFLLAHPRTYLTAFFNANSIVWEMGRPDDARAAEWNWMLDFARSPAELPWGGTTLNTGFTSLVTSIADFSYQNPIYRCLVWRGGSSLFVLFLCAAALLFKRRAALLIALIAPLTYSGMLLLSAPSQDPRYCLPALVTAVFFGVFVLATVETRAAAPCKLQNLQPEENDDGKELRV